MFSEFELKPPASGFQSYLTVASRLLHLYSIDDKTSRLMMFLHSEGHMERYTELHGEEKREIEMTRRRRGGIKRGETDLASNQFPKCSTQSGSLRDVYEVTEKRQEGDRGGQEDNMRNQKERDRSSQ